MSSADGMQNIGRLYGQIRCNRHRLQQVADQDCTARGPRYQDLPHWKLAVYDIFTSSYGPADLTSVSIVMALGLERL